MRLTPNKIEYLSEKILKLFQDNPRIHLLGNSDLVLRAIGDQIYQNMQQEEEIEQEVDVLLGQHRGEIEAMEMDLGMLRLKLKREVAKKKGFVL